MTTTDLDSLYTLLDQSPTDHNLLLAIADLEMESRTGGRLGLGLRALAECKRVPWWASVSEVWCWWEDVRPWATATSMKLSLLPEDWLTLCRNGPGFEDLYDVRITTKGTPTSGAHRAYIAAAMAFTLLPTDRQEQLLRGET